MTEDFFSLSLCTLYNPRSNPISSQESKTCVLIVCSRFLRHKDLNKPRSFRLVHARIANETEYEVTQQKIPIREQETPVQLHGCVTLSRMPLSHACKCNSKPSALQGTEL
ncbi:hypothetical protein BDW69DRAFT_166660 [Aspergillus filifer]